MILKTDSALETEAELIERIKSINRQISKLDSILNLRGFDAYHKKYTKLVRRKQALNYYLTLLTRFGPASLRKHLSQIKKLVWTEAGLALIEPAIRERIEDQNRE